MRVVYDTNTKKIKAELAPHEKCNDVEGVLIYHGTLKEFMLKFPDYEFENDNLEKEIEL